jgi:hypothetical protein
MFEYNSFTGIFATLAGTALVHGAAEVPIVIESWKAAHPYLLPLAKASIAFPLSYHTLFGIRHLVRCIIIIDCIIEKCTILYLYH